MLKHSDSRIDWLIFFGSVATIILLCIPLALNPDSGKQFLENAFDYLTANFGFLYVLAAIIVFGFLLFLAFGRYGDVSFGVMVWGLKINLTKLEFERSSQKEL